MVRMYHSRHLGDSTIRCGEEEYKVDSFVMRIHSDVLARACEEGFKVSHL